VIEGMDRNIISKIQAEMATMKAPGYCSCCPIILYENLCLRKLRGVGCSMHWIDLCERLGIKYSGGIGCGEFYKAFMDLGVRFCRI
jgi:hypothetical protein